MKTLLTSLLLSISIAVIAQVTPCGNHLLLHQMEHQHPGFKQHLEEVYEQSKSRETLSNRSTYVAKVVFHILHENEAENIPDEVLIQQLEQVNNDFNRLSEDADETRPIFQDIAGSMDIRFELADVDPDGNPTTGINRVPTDVTSFFDLDVFGFLSASLACGIEDPATITPEQQACLDSIGFSFPDLNDIKKSETGGIEPWDTERYINIWVGDYSINLLGEETPFLLGFAFPPFGLWGDLLPYTEEEMREIDGVTVHYQAVGPNNNSAGPLLGTNDTGKTLTHEMGHYLGLRHVWGDGDCAEDDGLQDTPAMANSTSGLMQEIDSLAMGGTLTCEELHLFDSCTEDSIPDMVENYMNYATESCLNMFTLEQMGVMEAVLNGPRASLFTPVSSTDDVTAASVRVYPNPATDVLHIQGLPQTTVEGQILTVEGRPVQHFTGREISISALPAGTYVLQLLTEGEVEHQVFVKQ